ncbi:MAG: arylsulfatase [Acidimicrobiales bacterium]
MNYEPKPRPGSPHVVVVVLDDTGFAQLGCYGSDIATPHMDRLAGGGLRYNRFHVTALCSPTRAAFVTGRNHHAVGMGFLTQLPLDLPGYTARLPRTAAPLPRVLRDAGYSTMAFGKWHLTPAFHRSAAGPFHHWPLGAGFERYYGFLQGDANHWAPDLIEDNHYLDVQPEPGPPYHLTEDLVERARRSIVNQQNAAPGKPFFLYLALGAAHSPHHVADEWVRPYEGAFDGGWDEWRAAVFRRQLASGVVPPGTQLTPREPWVEGWDDVPPAHRRMHARQQEVFAGFLTHADAQIGRLVTLLEEMGILDDTLLVVFSDNGASAEGGRHGSANELRRGLRMRDSPEVNLGALDHWGGPETYNHYSWAWAWAGNTPFRLWKRYTWLGGTRTPLIVHWPRRIAAGGQVRPQVVHAVDLAPTILDAAGLRFPEVVDGVTQQRVDGRSFVASFEDPEAESPRDTQYFEMLGSRAIVHGRWKATTDHVSTGVMDEEELATGSRRFEDDGWALFDLDADFSESTDLAAEHPDVLRRLQELWLVEAGRNQVMPLGDDFYGRMRALIPPAWPSAAERTFRPDSGPVFDESLPSLAAGFTITVDATVPAGGAEGILVALGDWHGGLALFCDGGRLVFSLSRAGELLELVGDEAVPGGRHRLGVRYRREDGGRGEIALLHDGTPVGARALEGPFPGLLQYTGAGLRIGRDSGLPVSGRYRSPFPWTGELGDVHLAAAHAPDGDPVALVDGELGRD